ncbi:alpha/beta fold hydrolase [Conexibacter sp. CPCC 206217]|uniref:alpha/beta fold hydrolase n=1 Tax=Conexibacter sp. CPCC 206217 TaxID=3064574 RepID=UPI0027285D4D|nr:alpha/beta fold hydrolase [Conexibacter sp. CPCC 206217]MDO8211829.1 alpha/beta fold hydrolase [Conexibacter sp. CPCC 206217]
MSRSLAVLIVMLGLALGVAAAPASADLALAPCGRGDAGQCGKLRVPLDRSGRVPGTLDLRVRVLPSRSAMPVATVFGLAGGPGQAASPLVEQFADSFGAAGRTRRFVAFDQRGTGGSGQLRCRALARSSGSLSAVVGACARELGPARAQYTTAASVADMEAVRAALGVDRIVLYATSYGTKVALDYAAAYPRHVEALVLDSVVPAGGVDPFQRTTLASIGRVLGNVCSDDGCRFTRNPLADLATLVRRMARGPFNAPYVTAEGRRRTVQLGRAQLFSLLLAGDFSPFLRAAIPGAVASALRGDGAALVRLVGASQGGSDGGSSDALYLATTCEDGGVPWPLGTPLDERRAAVDAAAGALPQRAFAPFDRATVRELGLADICSAWPESPVAQPTAPLPDVPTLILSGDDDLRTPRADALALGALLPRATVVEVPNSGHSVLGSDPTDCAERAVNTFLAGGTPRNCRPARRVVAPASPAPRSLAALPAPRTIAGRRGRTLTAALLTFSDAGDQVNVQLAGNGRSSGAFGGLRGGSAALDPRRGLLLRDYAFVPGVTLSGWIDPRARSFTFDIGGPAAAHGRLTFSRRGVTGRLDGRRVQLVAAASASSAADAPAIVLRSARAGAAGLRQRGPLAPAPLSGPAAGR